MDLFRDEEEMDRYLAAMQNKLKAGK